MALTLTPIATDNFHRADAASLGANWTQDDGGDPSLVILSDQCATDATDLFGVNYYSGAATPADQYAEITIGADGNNQSLSSVSIRCTTDFANGYGLNIIGPLSTPNAAEVYISVEINGADTYYPYDQFQTVNPGDTFALAAIGSTIYLLYNGTAIWKFIDKSFPSGVTFVYQYTDLTQADAVITNFVMGSASGSTPAPGLNTYLANAGYGTDISTSAEFTSNPAAETNSNRTAVIGTNRGSRFIG